MRSASVAASSRLQIGARKHLPVVDAGAGCDGASGTRMIAGDHDNANAGSMAFRDRAWHFSAQRIGEPHQANELEVEIVLDLGPALIDAGLAVATPSTRKPRSAMSSACKAMLRRSSSAR